MLIQNCTITRTIPTKKCQTPRTKMSNQILKAHDIEYVILKSRSPSCGLNHIYDGTFSHNVIDADGIFVRLLKKEGYKIYTEENYPGKL